MQRISLGQIILWPFRSSCKRRALRHCNDGAFAPLRPLDSDSSPSIRFRRNTQAGTARSAPCPRLKLPAAVDHGRAAERYTRRRADVALPDAAIIELNAHAIGRIDSALVARIDPDSAEGRGPVGPGTVGLARFRREVHGVPVLRDEGGSADHAVPAHLDAPVGAGQVDRFGRGASGGARSQEAQGQRQSSHQDHSIACIKMSPSKRTWNKR
jgi:hypothetical protein